MAKGGELYPVTMIMLEKEDRQAAMEYHNKVMEKVRAKGPNYTYLETKDRFFIGRCGEIALAKWAVAQGIVFEETVRDDGFADKQDFIFYARKSGKPCSINVKNSLHPAARFLMQPVSQNQIHKQDMYIAATGEDDGERVAMLLWGAVTRKFFEAEAEEVMHSVRTLQMPVQDMTYSMDRIARSFMKTSDHGDKR